MSQTNRLSIVENSLHSPDPTESADIPVAPFPSDEEWMVDGAITCATRESAISVSHDRRDRAPDRADSAEP
jgi:hypothetical protein